MLRRLLLCAALLTVPLASEVRAQDPAPVLETPQARPVITRDTDGEPSINQRVFAESLERSLGLGGPARLRAVRWLDPATRKPIAKGVQVRLPGLEVERVVFRSVADALTWGRRLAESLPTAVVEVRGRHVLVQRGAPLQDPAYAALARRNGWDVITAPPRTNYYQGPEQVQVAVPGRDEAEEKDPLEVVVPAVRRDDRGVTDLMRAALRGGPVPPDRKAPPEKKSK